MKYFERNCRENLIHICLDVLGEVSNDAMNINFVLKSNWLLHTAYQSNIAPFEKLCMEFLYLQVFVCFLQRAAIYTILFRMNFPLTEFRNKKILSNLKEWNQDEKYVCEWIKETKNLKRKLLQYCGGWNICGYGLWKISPFQTDGFKHTHQEDVHLFFARFYCVKCHQNLSSHRFPIHFLSLRLFISFCLYIVVRCRVRANGYFCLRSYISTIYLIFTMNNI